MRSGSLVALLHLCDSLFPTGGYAHSDGLEAAVADGHVKTALDLASWLDACLEQSIASSDGPGIVDVVMAVSVGDWQAVARVDEELHALRPSSGSRRAARSMGRRLLITWRAAHPEHTDVLAQASGASLDVTFPVAFAIVCANLGVAPQSAVEAYAYTRLSAAASCAMRLMPIGQTEAHAMLARVLERVPAVAMSVERRVLEGWRPGSFTPMLDLAQMRHIYVHSRLFLS